MIRLTYKNFRGDFLPAYNKLKSQSTLPQKTAYAVAKIASQLDKYVPKAQAEFLELVQKYAELGENGEIKPSDAGPGTFQIHATKNNEWKVAVEAFESKEVVIDRPMLTLGELEYAKLTPNDYLALEPLIVEMDVVPSEASA